MPELLRKVEGRAGVVEPGALQAELGAEAEAELDGVDVVAPDGEVEARHSVLVVVQRVTVDVAAGLDEQPQRVVAPDGGRLRRGQGRRRNYLLVFLQVNKCEGEKQFLPTCICLSLPHSSWASWHHGGTTNSKSTKASFKSVAEIGCRYLGAAQSLWSGAVASAHSLLPIARRTSSLARYFFTSSRLLW